MFRAFQAPERATQFRLVQCVFKTRPVLRCVQLKRRSFYTTNFNPATKSAWGLRFLSTTKDPDDKDNDEPDSDSDTDTFELEAQTPVRNLLYPNAVDPKIQRLKECAEIEDILGMVEPEMSKEQVVQAVLSMWDRLKDEDTFPFQCQVLRSQAAFQALLALLGDFVGDMDENELTCTLLYLTKLEVDLKDSIMQDLVEAFLTRCAQSEPRVQLPAISKFCVALNSIQGLYPKLVCVNTIPVIAHHLDACCDQESLRLLTICFSHLYQILSHDMLDHYRRKVKELIEVGAISGDNVKCILKILNFLNYPKWSHENVELIRELCGLLSASVEKMPPKELVVLNKVFQSQLEPADLMPRIAKQSLKLLEQSPSPDLLTCSVLYALPEKRAKMRDISQRFLQTRNVGNSVDLTSLFKVLRLLKISDVKIIDQYWDKVHSEIRQKYSQLTVYQYGKYCHRYMHFNNNLGGTYRYEPIEKALSKIVIKELEIGMAAHIPSLFAKLSSFVIAYGHGWQGGKHKDALPEFILDGMEEMVEQFSVIDCLYISRGLQIALEMRFRNFVPTKFGEQIVQIENVLNAAAERHLLSKDLSLRDVNSVLRSHNNRKSSRKTALFQKIIGTYNSSTSPLNSRLIREITFNLSVSGHRIDTICNRIIDYIAENDEHIIGDTVEKILYSCYLVGYQPETDKSVAFQKAADIILRDFDFISGLSIIQSCLALSFYKSLPETLIQRVFNITFIRRLEEEIKTCYSKATYPERVSNKVMQLNRAVCLDFPESGVPWFQQNYIEAHISRTPTIRSRFHTDVKSFLVSLLPDSGLLREGHITPYGYQIDFVVHLDRFKNFIRPPKNVNALMEHETKLAILPLRGDTMGEHNLKGQEQLKQRHLEMLGYKVVHIYYSEWNSMYMNVPGAKMTYLKGLLEIT